MAVKALYASEPASSDAGKVRRIEKAIRSLLDILASLYPPSSCLGQGLRIGPANNLDEKGVYGSELLQADHQEHLSQTYIEYRAANSFIYSLYDIYLMSSLHGLQKFSKPH